MEQEIRFCRGADGVQLAYASHGRGPAVVKAANWVTHLEFDFRSPLWRHWWEELGRRHRVVRYDERGCGLSDREPESLTFEDMVSDLASIVDATGLERFALLGVSQGGAVAIRYAIDHPERVSRVVLCGAFARGARHRGLSAEQLAEMQVMQSLVRVGWGKADPRFRRVFTTMFVPEASEEQKDWFDELMHISTAPNMAIRLRSVLSDVDISDALGECRVPALVAHARGDSAVPFEEGRLLAAGLPNARFLPLDSANHVLLDDEPAWGTFVAEVHAFLGDPVEPGPAMPDLTRREREVLALVTQGLTNAQVAGRLYLSPRTVERHLSNVYAKLGVSGKSARAAAAAFSSRLLEPAPVDRSSTWSPPPTGRELGSGPDVRRGVGPYRRFHDAATTKPGSAPGHGPNGGEDPGKPGRRRHRPDDPPR